jgi:hypothetical protein
MTFFFFENHTFYEIMWKNVAERGRLQTIWRMRIACWMPKSTNTHSKYVILIAFPLQQWLYERTSMLHYTYIACPVSSSLSRQTMQQWHEKLQAYVAFGQILYIYIYIYICVCVCVCVCMCVCVYVCGVIINIKPHWNVVDIGFCSLAARLSQFGPDAPLCAAFRNHQGVEQADALLPLIVNFALECAVRKVTFAVCCWCWFTGR